MDKSLRVAMSVSDRTLPLITNQVRVPGIQVEFQNASVEEIFERQLTDTPYDIAELSLASYLIALERGESRLTAIPAFLSRSFRHNAIYVRTNSSFVHPTDLKKKRFGFPEYQMTAAVWVRGMFHHEWGMDTQDLEWVTYRPERIPVSIPATRGHSKDIFDALVSGEVDAIMSARRPPEEYFPKIGEPGAIRRLFPNAWEEERNYYTRTGIFPIMHLVSIRKDVIENMSGLPPALYDALNYVKQTAVNNLAETVKLGATLPFAVESFEQAARLMSEDVWPYGVKKNWGQIEIFMQYLIEDGLITRPLSPEEVFHPSVLDT